jgi:radical SAM superfamily enzyme YgiQ (UPF0313 family)
VKPPRALLININRMKPPVLPLGLDLIADALDRQGIEVAVLDLAISKSPLADIGRAIKKWRPHAAAISIRNLDDCYYASQAFLLPKARPYVQAARDAGAPVIVGGVGFSVAPAAALELIGADFGVAGDGEPSLPAIVRALAEGRNNFNSPGLVRPGQADPERALAPLKNIETPTRRWFDPARYFQRGGQGNLETSRGCNRKCIYCADPVAKGTKVRSRDPQSVAEEIERLLALGVWALHLCDSEFNLSRAHAEAVCKAIVKKGLGDQVKWWTYALPAPMDRDLASLMARAGCQGIDFSVDAAGDEMLETYRRGFTVRDLETCADACRHAGIVFMYDLLLGGPGETRATLKRTISRIKKIKPHRAGVSFGVRVFPGTELGRMVLAQGPLADNPCIHGVTKNNDSLLRPIFYVSDRLGAEPEKYLKSVIGVDRRFLFASREDLRQNYNYNNNRPLVEAIRQGERGAYWDILRRRAES